MKTNMIPLLVLPFVSIAMSLLVTENEKINFNQDTLKVKNEMKKVIKILDLQEGGGDIVAQQRSEISWRDKDREGDRYGKDSFKCPANHGAFPDPKDCSRFYVCKNGRSTHKKCQNRMMFDKYRRTCLPKFIAVCDDGKDDQTTKTPGSTTKPGSTTVNDDGFKCPGLYGNHPHPAKCDKYYLCILFRATLMTCPESKLFDAIKKQCEAANNVHCGSRERPDVLGTTAITSTEEEQETTTADATETSESEPTLPTTREIVITTVTEEPSESTLVEETSTPVETITTEEYKTTTETIIETTTEVQTEEPTTTKVTAIPTTTQPTTTPRPTGPPETDCDEDDVDCIITETGDVSNWFTCPRDIGSYVHPSSNKLFIFCLNWKPSVKRCGQDLIFSPELSTCVQP